MGTSPPQVPANVRSLWRVRVLLAATDPRFLRAAAFLLEREGFDVVAACAPADAVRLMDETRPHVVVLDGGDSRAAAGRAVLALQAERPTTPVLVVSEGASGRVRSPFLRSAECRSFPELILELTRLYGSRSTGAA